MQGGSRVSRRVFCRESGKWIATGAVLSLVPKKAQAWQAWTGFWQNIQNNPAAAVPSGYVNGSRTDKLVFATETMSVITAGLPSGGNLTGLCNSSMGVQMGSGAAGTEVYKMPFASETSANIGSTLGGNSRAASVNVEAAGYAVGGQSSGSPVDWTQKILFSSGTTSQLSSTLQTAYRFPSGSNTDSNGYRLGGDGGAADTDSIDRMPISTESWSRISAVLSDSGYGSYGVQSALKSYTGGGCGWLGGCPNATYAQSFVFSTETSVRITNALNLGNDVGGVNSGTTGYFSCSTRLEPFAFSTETWSSTYLTIGGASPASGFQSGGYY